jgi:hypothetical protein
MNPLHLRQRPTSLVLKRSSLTSLTGSATSSEVSCSASLVDSEALHQALYILHTPIRAPLTVPLSLTVPHSPTSVLGDAQKTFVLTFSPSKRRLPASIDLVQAEYSVTQVDALEGAAEEEGVQIELTG